MIDPECTPPVAEDRQSASHRAVSPPAWQRALRRAERQAEKGLFSEALTSFEQAVRRGADGYQCYLRMADLHRALENWQEAFVAAETAVALAPDQLPAYETLVALALETGNYERAVAVSRTLLKISPRHVLAHDMLGAAYIQMGDVDAAMRVINTLIRIDPDTAAHHFKKALLCQHKSEIPLAVQEFSRTLRLEPHGQYAEDAREALEILDAFQLNQIVTLALEDRVFRLKLLRDAVDAATEKGFYLSDVGSQMLIELSHYTLSDFPEPCRPYLYN